MEKAVPTKSVSKTLMEFSRPLLEEMQPFLKNDDSDKKILENIFFITRGHHRKRNIKYVKDKKQLQTNVFKA